MLYLLHWVAKFVYEWALRCELKRVYCQFAMRMGQLVLMRLDLLKEKKNRSCKY